MTKVSADLTTDSTHVKVEELPVEITISSADSTEESIFKIALNKHKIVAASAATITEDYDELIQITANPDFEVDYLARSLNNELIELGAKIPLEEQPVPTNMKKTAGEYVKVIFLVLSRFGYQFAPVKKAPAKKLHRWNKEVSTIPFYVDAFDSKATVYWQKRNEMLIKKGATLKTDVPLNKDGSVGFAARFTEQLRTEQADKIKDGKTTEDIILKSVNEVGNFLYYAGTNSWLVLKDADGKTIDEYTEVK
ncbi:hypothetical protein [Lactobacillus terrae]|uniref:hypothetical protein n=1 Tax=Lactobacillus terrae TaxID=2269374 RepID=UPI001FE7BD35|nr:hypothetical protein [Lactobacillus terrae]